MSKTAVSSINKLIVIMLDRAYPDFTILVKIKDQVTNKGPPVQ
jgi:hypothetical protein